MAYFVTGATAIGRGTALRVGAAGGKVILVARGVEKLEETRKDIEELGGTACVHGCDLSDMHDIERLGKVSSIGVQTNVPRFSAYVASRAALGAFSRCIASEVVDDRVHPSTVHIPLVRTPMIGPTSLYDRFPTMTPAEAAHMSRSAMIRKPKKVTTTLGNIGELAYALAPGGVDTVLTYAYKRFPDSSAAKGAARGPREQPTGESLAFAHIPRGVHW